MAFCFVRDSVAAANWVIDFAAIAFVCAHALALLVFIENELFMVVKVAWRVFAAVYIKKISAS